jgi:hypothetical protein
LYPPLPLCQSPSTASDATTATTTTTSTSATTTALVTATGTATVIDAEGEGEGAGDDDQLEDFCSEKSPSWLTEKLNESDDDSDNDTDNDEDNDDRDGGKRFKTSHALLSSSKSLQSSPTTAPPDKPKRASSLSSSIVYAYDASQALAMLNSQSAIRPPVPMHPPQQNSAEHHVVLDEVNARKRDRQIQVQRHSVVFSRTNSGPTASYMGICRLPLLEGDIKSSNNIDSGTRSQHRHRRIDIKSYPRSYLPFAMLYFTGKLTANQLLACMRVV